MEEKYMKRKIKKELIKKKFNKWNKESINLLVYVYQSNKYESFFEINTLLLDDYIKWYKNQPINYDMYNFNTLVKLYCMIKEDLFYNRRFDYMPFLMNQDKPKTLENNSVVDDFFDYLATNTFCGINLWLFVLFFMIITRYLGIFLSFRERKIETPKPFEFKVPQMENLLNNPFIKDFLIEKFLI
jgi:Fe2+ transport system protein B